ncbi:MAG: hypothetical protein M3072_01250 [Candidatus Dormibacteraeota bacterium]|nr:hypothetical protein [Candidatus Dormibacteraeota bacterium]
MADSSVDELPSSSTGMQVLDDGSHVQLAPGSRFHDAVAKLVQPERLSLAG